MRTQTYFSEKVKVSNSLFKKILTLKKGYVQNFIEKIRIVDYYTNNMY